MQESICRQNGNGIGLNGKNQAFDRRSQSISQCQAPGVEHSAIHLGKSLALLLLPLTGSLMRGFGMIDSPAIMAFHI